MNFHVIMRPSQILALELLASVIYNWHNRFMSSVMISTKIIWLQKDLIQLKNARLPVKVVNKLRLLILAVVKALTGKLIKIKKILEGLTDDESFKNLYKLNTV